MARIRTIKPEFWTDEDMSELSEPACLLAIGLLNYADDEGYFNANPKLIRAAVFPIREPSRSVPVLLRELSTCGYIAMYSTSDGKHFGHICNFSRHQVVNKPRTSKIRGLELIPYDYGSSTGSLLLGMDQGSGNREREETPHSACEEKSLPPVDNFSEPEKDPLPQVNDNPGGKFAMFEGWKPDDDFQRRAAVWGMTIRTQPEETEIAEFTTYWCSEQKFFTQMQWEQKLARSIVQRRSKPTVAPQSRMRDITVMPEPDKAIPDGWRGA